MTAIRFLLLVACFGGLISGIAHAAVPLTPGDRNAVVDSYDVARQAVRVGRQSVRLTPQAAASLDQQLAAHRIPRSNPFGARFSVIGDSAGSLTIEAIHVYPPKRP
jgi:hypothetical protein